jgi:hypothetical protein
MLLRFKLRDADSDKQAAAQYLVSRRNRRPVHLGNYLDASHFSRRI